MENMLILKKQVNKPLTFICLALLGCALMCLGSLAKIPFYPVPFTLQTFVVILLALTQSPKQAAASIGCYLLCATLGLPVFCGHARPLWFLNKCGGYLVAFPIAAYLIAKLSKKIAPFFAVLCGLAVIYAIALLWLIPLFGLKVALMQGVIFFIPADLLKGIVAVAIVSGWKKRRQHAID